MVEIASYSSLILTAISSVVWNWFNTNHWNYLGNIFNKVLQNHLQAPVDKQEGWWTVIPALIDGTDKIYFELRMLGYNACVSAPKPADCSICGSEEVHGNVTTKVNKCRQGLGKAQSGTSLVTSD